jgi:hypothetical protein
VVSRAATESGSALHAAHEDHDSVVALTHDLVRIPSRAGIDPYGPVLECMATWLSGHGLRPRLLPAPGGATAAMVCEISSGQPCGSSFSTSCPAGRMSLTSTVASVTPRPNLTRRVTCSHGLPATAGLADADHEFLEGLRDHLAILRTVPVKDQGEQVPPPDQNGVRADLVGAGRGAER